MKIVTRLWLLFVLVGVLPLALFSYFNLQQDEATLREVALDRMSDLADKKAIQVKSYLAERVQDVRLMANSRAVTTPIDILDRNFPSRQNNAGKYVREEAQVRRHFERYLEGAGRFYDAFLITPRGVVVYTYKHEADFATNLLAGPWRDTQLAQAFRTASMTLEPVISGYEYYAPSSAPALFIAAPIMSDGKFKGVFAVQLGNELFYKVATDATGLGLSGEAVFAQRDKNGILFTTPLKYHADAPLKFRLEPEEHKATGMFPAVAGESQAGMIEDYRGSPVVAAWRYLPELDWGMVVKIDADEVFASIYRQRIVMLETVLGLLLFSGLIAYYFGRRISAPLNGLARTVGGMAMGNLDERADESAPGELGLFAQAFNRMADKLHGLYSTLEDRVNQRTAELKQRMDELRIKDAAIASSINAIAIAGLDGKLSYVNQAFVDMWRLQGLEDAIGHSPLEFWDKPEDAQAVMEALQQQGRWQGELVARRHDGSLANMQLSANMVMDEAGQPVCMMASFVDISARKMAETELQRSTALMESLLANMPVMAFVKRASDLRIEKFNRAAELLVGYSEQEMLGKSDLDVFPTEQAEFYIATDREVLASHQMKDIPQEPVTTRSGELRFLHTRKIGIYDEAGNPTHLLGIAMDITEQKRAEDALKESREQAMDALEKLRHQKYALDQHSIVAITDVSGTITYANAKFSEISGYAMHELIGQNHRMLNSGTHPKEFFRDMYSTIATGKVWHGEICNRAKDGHQYWLLTTIVPYLGSDGKPIEYIAIRTDISVRKQAEEMLKTHKQVLEFSNDGFWMVDGAGNIVEANQAYARISGYTVEELVHMQVTQLEAKEQAEETRAHIENIITQGYDNFETRHRHKDGHEIDINVSAVFIREKQQIAGFFRDITESKRARFELQHNRDLLNAAEQLGQLGSWELNLVSGELFWSAEIYRIFELDPAQFKPSYENFLNVIHPDDRDKVNRAYTQSLEDRQNYDIEHRLLMADGRIKWVREHYFSEFDASGKPLRSVGAVQDITEPKFIEERLQEAAVTFEAHEAIMITDINANIVRVNKAFQRVTGYSAEEVLGKNPRVLSSGRQSRAFYEEMWRELLDKGTWHGEMWDRHKDGHVYPKWLTVTAVMNEYGQTKSYVAMFSDITERKRVEEEVRNLAFYDPLTKLPNRRLLLDRFHLAISASARNGQYGAVLFLDMDRFKTINDTMGHDHGDQLLIEVAKRIQFCVREMDTVARIGGDEFVILVEVVSPDSQGASQKTAQIAEKIRAELCVPYQINNNEYHSSPSIGVCLYRGNEETVDNLLKYADMAMYQAKESGRNAVRFFDPQMQLAVETHAALEADLRRAVPNNQLQLHYQIQVDNEHRPLGAEALVRWIHPKRGMVSPAQFIPIAEESGLILDIGHWVMETACKQLAEWDKSEHTRHLILAVNVSGQQFRKHDFVDSVDTLIRAFHVDSTRLKLELTESVVLNDVADVVKKMHALKALGVKLSMDDFGTGYSSLSYLKQLPLDQIKIDQSFVRDITSDPNDAVMVQTIIGLGTNFRLNVIAEGVETHEQLEFLKANGCKAYQGYLFSRPVQIGDFAALLEKKL